MGRTPSYLRTTWRRHYLGAKTHSHPSLLWGTDMSKRLKARSCELHLSFIAPCLHLLSSYYDGEGGYLVTS